MKLIIHDILPDNELSNSFAGNDNLVIPAVGTKAPCTGCFGCWIKTPGKCVLRDRIKDMGKHMASCDELIIISQSVYGGFSPDIKNVIDRSISYLLPFFRNIDREQHHKPRYRQQFKLSVIIYNSTQISDEEQGRMERYIKAVSVNLNVSSLTVVFAGSEREVRI